MIGRDGLDEGRAFVEGGERTSPVEASAQRNGGRKAIAQIALSARIAVGVEAVDAPGDVEMRDAATVNQAVQRQKSAADARQAAGRAQSAAVDRNFAVRTAAARRRLYIEHSADRVRPVKRRPRTAQELQAVRIDRHEILKERNGAAVRIRGVAEAQAVDQNGRVPIAQAAGLNRRQTSGAAQLPHAHARYVAHGLGNGKLPPSVDLVGRNDARRLGAFPSRLGRAGRGDEHHRLDTFYCERNIVTAHVAADAQAFGCRQRRCGVLELE